MDPGPRNATVTALTDLDVLIIGPRELSAMSDIPGFRGALFRSMARRLRIVEARLADCSTRRIPERTGRPLDIGDLRPFAPPVPGAPPTAVATRTLTTRGQASADLRERDGRTTARGAGKPHRSACKVCPGLPPAPRSSSPRWRDRRAPAHSSRRGDPAGGPARSRALRHFGGDGDGHPRRVTSSTFCTPVTTSASWPPLRPCPAAPPCTATTDLDVLIVGPREFETMMEIPGFRNALLSGMSRRIREADDRLAAYEEQADPGPDLPEGDAAPRLIGQPGSAACCASRCSPMAQRCLLGVAQEHRPPAPRQPSGGAGAPFGPAPPRPRPRRVGSPCDGPGAAPPRGAPRPGRGPPWSPPRARGNGRPVPCTPRPAPGPRPRYRRRAA